MNIRIKDLARIHQRLITLGYHAELHTPNLDDPLGGVIDVSGTFGMVQIVNYGDRFPAVSKTLVDKRGNLAKPSGHCPSLYWRNWSH